MKADGSLSPYQVLQINKGKLFKKFSFSGKWQPSGEAYFPLKDRLGPTFTSCRLLSRTGKLLHYAAAWHEFPYEAKAELWISKDEHRLVRMLRRYPKGRSLQLPFAVALDVYDYDATAISSATQAPRPDPSCVDVNNAYRQDSRPPRYTINIYQVRDDGSLKPYQALRIDNDNTYTKYAFSDKWLTRGKAYFSIMDRMGPKFSSCKLLGEESSATGRLLHYAATWQTFPYTAAAELWVAKDSGRLMKTVRRYPDTGWQFPFAVALELYDYNPLQAALPGSQ